MEEDLIECPECDGEGTEAGLPCWLCYGAGYIEPSLAKQMGYNIKED